MRVQCSTCLELLTPGDDLACTPCGHVFHYTCVLQWFETGKPNCPQCRAKANQNTLRRVYLAETDGDDEVDASTLQNKLDGAQFNLRCKESEREKLATRNKELEETHVKVKEEVKKLEKEKQKLKDSAAGYKSQVRYLQDERLRYEEAKAEAERCRNQLENYKAVELVMKGCESDVNMMLHERGAFDGKSRDLATLVVTLKQKLADVKRERTQAESRARESSSTLVGVRKRVEVLTLEVSDRVEKIETLKGDVKHLEEENGGLKKKIEKLKAGDGFLLSQSPGRLLAMTPKRDRSPDMFLDSPVHHPSPKYTVPGVKRLLDAEDDSPTVPLKTCGIIGMRKPLTEMNKKQKMNSEPLSSMSKHYNGMGGRAREMDEFPQPKSQSFKMKQPSVTKKSNLKTFSSQGNQLAKNSSSQKKTIDRFFGSFDTP